MKKTSAALTIGTAAIMMTAFFIPSHISYAATKAPFDIQSLPSLNLIQSLQEPQLTIPAIKVNAPVLAMGLEKDGKMAVPNNFTEIGWYKFGAKPGQKGTAVLGAHVDNGGRIPGVFKNLSTLKKGEFLYYTNEKGEQLTFKVVNVKVYDRNQKDTTEVFAQNSVISKMNLITCHGRWLPWAGTYEKRLVVFTELQEKAVALK